MPAGRLRQLWLVVVYHIAGPVLWGLNLPHLVRRKPRWMLSRLLAMLLIAALPALLLAIIDRKAFWLFLQQGNAWFWGKSLAVGLLLLFVWMRVAHKLPPRSWRIGRGWLEGLERAYLDGPAKRRGRRPRQATLYFPPEPKVYCACEEPLMGKNEVWCRKCGGEISFHQPTEPQPKGRHLRGVLGHILFFLYGAACVAASLLFAQTLSGYLPASLRSNGVKAGIFGIALILITFASIYGWIYFVGDPMEKRRRLRSQCTQCGYSLKGIVSGVCPECGTPVSKDAVRTSAAPPGEERK